MERLLKRGLVTASEQQGTRQFHALDPKILVTDIQQKTKNLVKSLPLLQALVGKHDFYPTVRFFEDIDGIKQAYKETLKAKTDILNYANSRNIRNHWPQYDEEYVIKRCIHQIYLRGLAPDDHQGRKIHTQDTQFYREIRLLDKKHFQVENEINIYDDKLFIASFDPNPFVIIIQSQAVADTQRQIFEIAWDSAEN